MNWNKLFVLGLSRTGTTSLHAALVLMGHGSIHYPAKAARRWLAGNFRSDMLIDFDACMDLPTPIYYPQLDKMYPNSKFILLERNVDDWLESLRKQWAGASPSSNKTFLRDMIRVAVYGCAKFDADRMRTVYTSHSNNVKNYFRNRLGSDFVSMDITSGDGWDTLARFLQEPIPDEVSHFPRLRSPYIGPLAEIKNSEIDEKKTGIIRLIKGDVTPLKSPIP